MLGLIGFLGDENLLYNRKVSGGTARDFCPSEGNIQQFVKMAERRCAKA